MDRRLTLPPHWADHRVSVHVIGAGGTGSALLDSVASLDATLRRLGHPGFALTIHDGDSVSASNIGRARYTPNDVGYNKAILSAHRFNAFHELDWTASPANAEPGDLEDADLVITCVDTARFRTALAAHYQMTDQSRSLAELPTLGHFQSRVLPRFLLSPSQQMELLAAQCNSIIQSPGAGRETRVWGSHTLARPPEMNFGLVPVRRTMRALREAVESLAEAFVLEPLSSDIVLESEYRLRSFFEEHRQLFDLYVKDPFTVTTSHLSGKDMDGLEISCSFRLSRCIQELRLHFGVSQ